MRQPARQRFGRGIAALGSVAWLALGVLAYLALRWLFASRLGPQGLFSPSGVEDAVGLLLGLAVMTLRLVLLLAAPGLLTYQLVCRLLAPLPKTLPNTPPTS